MYSNTILWCIFFYLNPYAPLEKSWKDLNVCEVYTRKNSTKKQVRPMVNIYKFTGFRCPKDEWNKFIVGEVYLCNQCICQCFVATLNKPNFVIGVRSFFKNSNWNLPWASSAPKTVLRLNGNKEWWTLQFWLFLLLVSFFKT